MSTTQADRSVTTTERVIVWTCDSPTCSKTVEIPMRRAGEVPVGWISVRAYASNMPAAIDSEQHYCSRDCLADAVVP